MKPPRFRDLGAACQAAAALEFAVVVLPLLLIAFGVMEFSRMYWTRDALQETAIVAARCMGMLESSCASGGTYSASKTTSYVQQVASGWGISVTSSEITLNQSANCAGLSGFSQVSVTHSFQTAVPGLLPLPSGGVPLSVDACFPNQ